MRNLLAAWSFIAAAALFVHLGGYPLLDADEGRNGEIGREMAETNDYVLPHLDGLPYLDKPVVYFAAEAAVMEVLGPTETAARLPALIFTLLSAALVAWFARREGIDPALAAVIFLSMPMTMAFARTVIFDSALSLFITVAIIAFYLAAEGGGPTWRPATVAWAAMAVGVLTKGPVALAVPLLIAIPYSIWRRRFRALFSWIGLVVFVLIIAPWVWAVSRTIPDFLHYVLVTETAQRLATKALKRTGPPWYFVPYIIGGAFPWAMAAFFGETWRRLSRRREPAESRLHTYLLLWIALPFIFFSLSQSKRPQYILPLMPAIALYVASRWNERMTRVAAVTLGLLGALLVVAAPRANLRPEYAQPAQQAAIVIGAFAIAAAVVAWFVRRRDVSFIALTVPMLIVPLATNSLLRSLAERRSAKTLVDAVQRIAPSAEIVGVEAFSGSLAFYFRRPIVVVSPDAEEFTSNYLTRHYTQFADMPNSPLRSPRWLANALTRNRVVVVRKDDLENRALIEANRGKRIAESARFTAYTIAR